MTSTATATATETATVAEPTTATATGAQLGGCCWHHLIQQYSKIIFHTHTPTRAQARIKKFIQCSCVAAPLYALCPLPQTTPLPLLLPLFCLFLYFYCKRSHTLAAVGWSAYFPCECVRVFVFVYFKWLLLLLAFHCCVCECVCVCVCVSSRCLFACFVRSFSLARWFVAPFGFDSFVINCSQHVRCYWQRRRQQRKRQRQLRQNMLHTFRLHNWNCQ